MGSSIAFNLKKHNMKIHNSLRFELIQSCWAGNSFSFFRFDIIFVHVNYAQYFYYPYNLGNPLYFASDILYPFFFKQV